MASARQFQFFFQLTAALGPNFSKTFKTANSTMTLLGDNLKEVRNKLREYVAQVIIPARGYEIVDTGEKDEDGKTITKREPVPFDMKKCTLVLWALI